jgi:hypothetical protein
MEETGLEVEVDGDVVGGVQLKMNFGCQSQRGITIMSIKHRLAYYFKSLKRKTIWIERYCNRNPDINVTSYSPIRQGI